MTKKTIDVNYLWEIYQDEFKNKENKIILKSDFINTAETILEDMIRDSSF